MDTQKLPLRVMHLILNLEIGGGQEVVRTLVQYLLSDECSPVVCSFKDGPLRREIERAGVLVEILPGRQYSVFALPMFVMDMFRIWQGLAQLVKKHQIELIQTHLLSTLDFLVLLLRYTTPVRVVLWTFHNANFELTAAKLSNSPWLLWPKKLIHRQLYRLGAWLVNGFIAVSDDVKQAMINIIGPIGHKITVICNGVDTSRYPQMVDKTQVRAELGLSPNAQLIIVVATLKEQKGHRYLIDAMTSIAPRYPDVHVICVGDGSLRPALQSQLQNLNLTSQIHLLGNRYDIPRLLAASDLFVLPSLWEGLSMALLEAMATGLPIIATEVSGTAQVMIPDQTGLLVPPGDSSQLVQAIEQLITDPARATAMGAAAKQRVAETFSARKQAELHLALYRHLLQEK
jgi:glycosyltransferase involved in cell wall biosynthesis